MVLHTFLLISLPRFAQVKQSLQNTSDPAAPDAGNRHGHTGDISSLDTLPASGLKNAHIYARFHAVKKAYIFCAIDIDGCVFIFGSNGTIFTSKATPEELAQQGHPPSQGIPKTTEVAKKTEVGLFP